MTKAEAASYDVRIIAGDITTVIACSDKKEASDVFCEALQRTQRPLRVTIREWKNGLCKEYDNFYAGRSK